MRLINSSAIRLIWQNLILSVVVILALSSFWMPVALADSQLDEIKVSEIWQQRQHDGVIGTHKSAEEKAKKSLESRFSRLKCRSSLLISNAASNLYPIWKWTGISEKKGWDLLQLIISASIPFILVFGTQYFTRENNKQQQEIATDRYQQEALTKYFEQMSQLLLDRNLREEKSEARTIARARTLSTLRELDGSRKGLLVKFLNEAKLVSRREVVIYLAKADLSGADFSGAFFAGIRLSNTNLSGADFSGANLSGADFSGANLSGANFRGAFLPVLSVISDDPSDANPSNTDLSRANLSGADLSGACFNRTDFRNANLNGTNLSGTDLSRAEHLDARQIKSACFWEEAAHTDAGLNNTENKWIALDKKANQKRIEEIRQAPNPKNSPDCNGWK